MSAQPVEQAVGEADELHRSGIGQDATGAPEQVEVRRNAVVSALIGAAASAIAIAYLWRAVGTGAALDWVLCIALGVVAAVFLRSLLDSRTPLLIADEMGVRVRLGAQWRGLPWEAIDRVVVQPRRGALSDGRVTVSLRNVHRTMESLDGRGLRHARLNQRLYGAALAVPLGLATRVTGDEGSDLADRVAALSQGRAEVVTLLQPTAALPVPPQRSTDEPAERPVITDDTAPDVDRRPRWLRRTAPVDAGHDAGHDAGTEAHSDDAERGVATGPGDLGGDRSTAEPARQVGGDVPRDIRLRVLDSTTTVDAGRSGASAATAADDVSPAPRRSSRVRAIARLSDPVAPLVIGDFEPEPAYDPVIGPELAAARTRVGLSVDELADRTRIRPHVIESIEVDDFAPCGGDFYARGHIRTLARVLGKDPAPMLEEFESRYATAPVNARRVFEAELATGLTGSMRSTVGGPNWALLVAVVLSLVLLWSAVRLFAGDSQVTLENPPPVLNGSSGLGPGYGPARVAEPQQVPLTVSTANAGAHVEVRDGDGVLVYEADLAIGQSKQLQAAPPVTVAASNGAAVSVTLAGRDQGFLGAASGPATEVFQRPQG